MARFTALIAVLFAVVFGVAGARAAATDGLALEAPGNGTVRALVIGIDNYRSVANVPTLHGAVADARDIEASLRRMGAADVTALIDDDANRARVLKELDGMVARTKAGDLVIITLAGHGSKEDERVKGSSHDGSDEVFLLVGFDFRTGHGGTEKILNHEFHHYIKLLEAKDAQVIFVADACYGGGLAREVALGSAPLTYRQVPKYRLAVDDLKPVSTPAEAMLTELDFDRTTFLAAVDSQTKAPEITIKGIATPRGALSYAVARAIEGAADDRHDGHITLRELFGYARQVVYQLSDGKQNIVAVQSPDLDLDHDVVMQWGTRSVPTPRPTLAAAPVALASAAAPAVAQPRPAAPLRLATVTGRPDTLAAIKPLVTPFLVVDADANPDVLWDPVAQEAIAGSDKVAFNVAGDDLPGVVDRTAAVRDIKDRVARRPQSMTVVPDSSLHRPGQRIEIDVGDAVGRNLILVDIAGNGTVQMLYPSGTPTHPLTAAGYRLPFEVRDPFGADEVLAITSRQPMDALAQALQGLDNRRAAGRLVDVIARLQPPDARIGLVGVFTVP